MPIRRRTVLQAVPGLFVGAAAEAQVRPSAPGSLLADGGGAIDPSTAIAQLAASLSIGGWARLTSVTGQNAVIGNQSGSSGSLIGYGNTAAWNPVNKSIEIIGADHLGGASNWKQHVRYSVATNSFAVVQGQGALPNIGHAYDHTAVNPFNGDLYHANYSGFSGRIPVYRKRPGESTFTLAVDLAANDQVTHGACWWSGAFTGAGAQGFLLVYDCGNTSGQLRGYNPLNGSTFFSTNSASPGSSSNSYHTVLEYSVNKNVAVYGGGGGGNSNKLWRLSSNGSVTAMPSVPSGKAVGILDGNFCCDPVTGNFLLLSAGQLWELDPSGSGTWTQQSGARTPPSGVGDSSNGLMSCPVPDYGVVAYITQSEATTGSFYLYKHG